MASQWSKWLSAISPTASRRSKICWRAKVYSSSIFRAAPTGIGVVSNRILLAVNDRVCDMIGYSREEMIGQSARMLYPSDAQFENVGTEKYRQILQCGTGTVETQWQCKDGRIIDILMSSTPINPMDLAAGVTFTALDITERKKAANALRGKRGTATHPHRQSSRRRHHRGSGNPDHRARERARGRFVWRTGRSSAGPPVPLALVSCKRGGLSRVRPGQYRGQLGAGDAAKGRQPTAHFKNGEAIQLNGQEKLLECFVDLSERKRADEERQSLQSQLLQAQKMEL